MSTISSHHGIAVKPSISCAKEVCNGSKDRTFSYDDSTMNDGGRTWHYVFSSISSYNLHSFYGGTRWGHVPYDYDESVDKNYQRPALYSQMN